MTMRIAIQNWQGSNVEVVLMEELDDRTTLNAGSFFTTAAHAEVIALAGLIPQDPVLARAAFKLLEAKLPPPWIGGQFAHLHPYWKEHGWEVQGPK